MGLNGCEVPIVASLPQLLARGTNLLGVKSIYFKVDILQPTTGGQEPKAQPLSSHSSPIQVPSPIRSPLPKAEREVNMTMEVRELLSWVVLDTSGQAPGTSTPKRLNPIVVLTPPPPKLEDFPRPVDTSSKVSAPDDAETSHHLSLPTPGPDCCCHPQIQNCLCPPKMPNLTIIS